jgi:hypothetical protein
VEEKLTEAEVDELSAQQDRLIQKIIEWGKQGMQEAAADALESFLSLDLNGPEIMVRSILIKDAIIESADPKVAGYFAKKQIQFLLENYDKLAAQPISAYRDPKTRAELRGFTDALIGLNSGTVDSQHVGEVAQGVLMGKMSQVDIREFCDDVEGVVKVSDMNDEDRANISQIIKLLKGKVAIGGDLENN